MITPSDSPFASLPAVPEGVNYGEFTLTVKRYILTEVCKYAVTAVPARETTPVLGCLQVRVSEGSILRVAGTDMERTVFAQTGAFVHVGLQGVKNSLDVYIPARKLLAILEQSPEGDVSIAIAKNKAEITVSGGARWELRLPGSANYPKLPDAGDINFTAYSRKTLLTALKAVRHAICRDASQSNLTQVAITATVDPLSSAVTASDSSRMARVALPAFPIAVTVPSAAVDDLVRLLSGSSVTDIEVGQTPGLVAFRVGDVTLAANKRHTPFPNIDAQLLKQVAANSDALVVDKEALARAICQVRINADPETAAIALEICAGQVTVIAQDKGHNAAQQVVAAKWDGPSRVLVLNHVHLSEALAAHPDSSCEFMLGKDAGKRRSAVLLSAGSLTQVLSQMAPALVGY